ncbi:response regulator transcription factor [Anditalea andensis]|uniref:HTH luxR-type domain-containing protein n=1 Tax=Anditalea andensis TaxID=1048983 RepID=A0A074KZK5_9BACT|nr:response regulator transcription factor [Anditalea andensis]KEO73048.1 hypothetical protein EL17_15670 [Anditalea andensis]
MKYIFLYDSDMSFISSFRLFFERKLGKPVFCAEEPDQLFHGLGKKKPEIIFLELFSKNVEPTGLIDAIRKTHPDIPLYIISDFYHGPLFRNVAEHGVSGFLPKNTVSMRHALDIPARKEAFFSPASAYLKMADFKSRASGNRQASILSPLSARQIDILIGICKGRPNSSIAQGVGLSLRTVETYVTRILFDFDLRNRRELASFAAKNGICRVFCRNSLTGNCRMPSLFVR